MRILLVTTTELLPFTLSKVLNPSLEYCAIVVDEPDIAKQIFKNYPQVINLIHPLYELKECIENFYFEVAICISGGSTSHEIFPKEMQKYGLPVNKLISLHNLNSPRNFNVAIAMQYYKSHYKEFDIFATGISYTALGLVPAIFSPHHKLFNFSRDSQDLYYDYQTAKFVLDQNVSGGGGNIKYALIGFAPYSFHFDVTKSLELNFQVLSFFTAFNDAHNLWLSEYQYRNLFNEKYLSAKFPAEISNKDSVCGLDLSHLKYMTVKERIDSRRLIDAWKDKNYPETVKENVKILDDYLTLCEKNNVCPIMFLPPFTEGYKKYFSRQKLDEFYCLIHDAQKKHPSAKFLDGWKLQGFSDGYFHDAAHLNIAGAKRFSAIFSNFIEQLER